MRHRCPRAGHPCSSTSSRQKPGPMAIAMPQDPGRGGRAPQGVLEDVQHRGRRQVADPVQRVPGERRALHGRARASPAWPRGPSGRRGGRPTTRCRCGRQAVVGEEPVDVLADVGARPGRGPRRRARCGSRWRRCPSPSPARCRGTAGSGWPAPAAADLSRPPRQRRPGARSRVRADGYDRGGAVAEQPARDQVGDRRVVALHGQRAELDRQQHGDLVGVAEQVVVQPGDARGPGDAAEPHQRNPLHVRAQPEPGADRGRPARARRCPVTVVEMIRSTSYGVSPAALSASTTARAPRLDPDVDERVVGGAEVGQLGVASRAAAPGAGS